MARRGDSGLQAGERDLGLLIKGIAEGDEYDFAALYEATSPYVYGLTLRILGDARAAEDVMCVIYREVWKHASEYRRDGCEPITWLVMMTRNAALGQLHSGGRCRQDGYPPEESDDRRSVRAAYHESNPELVRRRELALSIKRALSPDERRSLELALFSGLTADEIAGRLNRPSGKVKAYLRQGLMKIREMLSSENGAGDKDSMMAGEAE